MAPSELPYSSEEEMILDQFAKNARLVAECQLHPGSYYRTYSPARTIERIDELVELKTDKLLALIKRNELQKKALILIVLRKYGEKCAVCPVH